ncbi:MAG: pyruvate dehydrogenase complex dehydrogenase (E1) component [Parasphingorhabdus sp.]|jgi:pyruvate dehydrogenase complex dehydrogenase (E1) component
MIAPRIPDHYTVLGTEGFGVSESRSALTEFFEISSAHIAASFALY